MKLNQYLQQQAQEAYDLSGYKALDEKYGMSKFNRTALKSDPESLEFRRWLGSIQSSHKFDIVSRMQDNLGDRLTTEMKKQALDSFNQKCFNLRYLVRLVRNQFNG